jgi:hypothetical protein
MHSVFFRILRLLLPKTPKALNSLK